MGDVRAVASVMRDNDFEEFQATSFYTARASLAHDLALRYGGRDDVLVGMLDGVPIWIGGSIETWPGTMTLMFFATNDLSKIGLPTTRWIKRELFPRYFASGVHRIQAISHGAHTQAHAWLKALGLAEEARFVAFGRERQDFVQFAKVV